ncbi:SAM-dependent methyltransferase [Acidobacteriota bacterium]
MKKTVMGMALLIGLIVLESSAFQQKRPEVPFVPTPEKVVEEMLKMADVNKDDILFDLGCGDGRIVITAVKRFGCRGVGIDIDPQRIKESRANAKEAGVSKQVEFFQKDLFETDLRKASVVTLYLLSRVNLRLRPKLFRELKPGTRIVSHAFNMADWQQDNSTVVNGSEEDVPEFEDPFSLENYWDRSDVYFWLIPANVTGTWEWTISGISEKKEFKMEIEQNFQMLTGQLHYGSSSFPVQFRDGKISGDKMVFTIQMEIDGLQERLHFEAIVRDHIMEGSMRIEGKSNSESKFKAKRIPSTYKTIEQ